MKILLFATLILSVGCSTMSQKVFTKIKIGDPISKVADLLGAPDIFQGSAMSKDGQVLVYKKGNTACGFEIRKETVIEISCRSKQSLQDPSSLLAKVFLEEN